VLLVQQPCLSWAAYQQQRSLHENDLILRSFLVDLECQQGQKCFYCFIITCPTTCTALCRRKPTHKDHRIISVVWYLCGIRLMFIEHYNSSLVRLPHFTTLRYQTTASTAITQGKANAKVTKKKANTQKPSNHFCGSVLSLRHTVRHETKR
jgi:hypothetical protein